MASYGKIEEFQPIKNISNYLECVEIFFQANGIADGKKVPVFLSIAGGSVYALLRSLLSPVKPQENTFDELKAELKKHFEPKKVVIAERFNFHRRNQASDESITEYVAELRKLTTNCDFGDYLEEALRDRFFCGLCSETTQKQLLTEAELTFQHAVEIAQAIEAAEKKSEQFEKTGHVEVNKLTHNRPTQPCIVVVNKATLLLPAVLRRNCVGNVVRKATSQEYVVL